MKQGFLEQLSVAVRLAVTVVSLGACYGTTGDSDGSDAHFHAGPSQTESVHLPPEAVRRGGIESARVEEGSIPRILRSTGRLQVNLDRTARVGSPTEALVTTVHVTVGDRVREGDPLVDLRSPELIRARSEHSQALSSLAHAEKSLNYARLNLERTIRLLEAKAVSQRDRQLAGAEVETAVDRRDRARAEVVRIEEFLAHLEAALDGADGLRIRSPINGVVLERPVTPGTVVRPGEDLLKVADLSTLWAVAEVPERRATGIALGQGASVEVAGMPGERFEVRVVGIGDLLNPVTRTVQVRCLLENRDGLLRPEMYARIEIDLGETAVHPLVPLEAVQRMDDGSVVFVDRGDGRFERRRVTTGYSLDGRVAVLEGLQPGERVVVQGAFLIKSEFLRYLLEEHDHHH